MAMTLDQQRAMAMAEAEALQRAQGGATPSAAATPSPATPSPQGGPPVPPAGSPSFLDSAFNEMRRDESIFSDAVPRFAAGLAGAPASFSNWANREARAVLPKSWADVLTDKPGFKSMPDIGATNAFVDRLEGQYAPPPPQGLKEGLIAAGSQGLVGGPLAAGRLGMAKALQSGVASGLGSEVAHEVFPKSETAPVIGGILAGGVPSAGSVEDAAGRTAPGNFARETFAPATIDESAAHAQRVINGRFGESNRATAIAETQLEPFHKTVRDLSPDDTLDLVHYMETRSTNDPKFELGVPTKKAGPPQGGKGVVPTGSTKGEQTYQTVPGRDIPAHLKAMQRVADTVRKVFQTRKTKLQHFDEREFVEDYFPHAGIWENEQAAQEAVNKFYGPGKEGAAAKANLMQRKHMTIEDGLRAGLKLKPGLDIIGATMKYTAAMDRFLASKYALEDGQNAGHVFEVPAGRRGPAGTTKLNTRITPPKKAQMLRKGTPEAEDHPGTPTLMTLRPTELWAKDGWARLYNRMIDKGFLDTSKGSDLGARAYSALERATGFSNKLTLGLSGWHATNMVGQAITSGVAKGISEIMAGSPVKGAATAIGSIAKPITTPLRGRKFINEYLNPGTAKSDLLRHRVELGTRANANVTKLTNDLKASAAGSYWKAFKRGTLKMEMASDFKETNAAHAFFKQFGRVLDTVSQPLFEHYIPKLKAGAFDDLMASWLEHNPEATKTQQIDMANRIWDSMDDRMGEINHDRLFWPQMLKQSLRLALRSYSYTMGTARQLGGGANDLMVNPRSLSIASPDYSPRAAYVLALPLTMGAINGVYQYLKTGIAPNLEDAARGGLTGGTDVSAHNKPERAEFPSDLKDVFGWSMNPRGEAFAKLNPIAQFGIEAATGKDWRNDPIASRNADLPTWLLQWAGHITGNELPLGGKQVAQGTKRGSNISLPEQLMGIRPASRYLTDPQGYERMMRGIGRAEDRKKARHDRKTQNQYKGVE